MRDKICPPDFELLLAWTVPHPLLCITFIAVLSLHGANVIEYVEKFKNLFCPPPPCFPAANTYFFMVQAQGIMLRDNVRTFGQMIRLYTNKNSTLNGTGT